MFLIQYDHLRSWLLGAEARSWIFPTPLHNPLRCKEADEVELDIPACLVTCRSKSFPAAELVSRPDVLRSSGAGLRQISDLAHNGSYYGVSATGASSSALCHRCGCLIVRAVASPKHVCTNSVGLLFSGKC